MRHLWSAWDESNPRAMKRKCKRCGAVNVLEPSGGPRGGFRDIVNGVDVRRGTAVPGCEPKPSEPMARLREWVVEHRVNCKESIYQVDSVIFALPELAEIVCEIVGFASAPADED